MPRIPGLPQQESAAAAGPTGKAADEEAVINSGLSTDELARQAAEQEHHRDQRFRDAFELVAIAALHLSYMALATIALVWALHLVLPDRLRWLSSAELNHVQTLLTAGVLVGVIGGHFKKRLSDHGAGDGENRVGQRG